MKNGEVEFFEKDDGRIYGTFKDDNNLDCIIEDTGNGAPQVRFGRCSSTMRLGQDSARTLAAVLCHFAETGKLKGGGK